MSGSPSCHQDVLVHEGSSIQRSELVLHPDLARSPKVPIHGSPPPRRFASAHLLCSHALFLEDVVLPPGVLLLDHEGLVHIEGSCQPELGRAQAILGRESCTPEKDPA